MFSKIKNTLIAITLILLLGVAIVFPNQAKGWFGAGSTPGWPLTTNGLRGQIALPEYKFSPDFYVVGNTVNINVQGFNTTPGLVTSHYYLAISRVTQSPTGIDITDGTPTTPGINENDLNTNHQASNDVQSLITVIDLGSQTFPVSDWHVFGGSYTTTQTGYYQFDFMDIDPSVGYTPGHILAAGFFRVLAGSATPTPAPVVTPTPTPIPSNGGGTSGSGGSSASTCNASKPPTPKLLSVTKTSSTTAQLTWSAVSPVSYYIISYGTSSGSYQFGVPNTGNTTSFTIGSLNPNVTYYFVVRAANDCTPGDPSNELSTKGGAVLGASTSRVLGASTDRLAFTGDLFFPRLVLSIVAGVDFFVLGKVFLLPNETRKQKIS